jgi:hypothetical protein
VLVKILEVNDGATVGWIDLSVREFLLERSNVGTWRLDTDGVSARRVTDGVDGSGVVSVGFVTATGLVTLETDGLEQLNSGFRSRVGVAGIEGSVVFVVKLEPLETDGIPL